MLALAGTLGVGNITGVAFGILVGGAGSVFWLFLSGVFASVLKFAESALAKDGAEGRHGGTAYLLRKKFPRRGGLLGGCYAVLCLALCLTMGAPLQAKTLAGSAASAFGVAPGVLAIPVALLTLLFVAGGTEKIEKFTLYFIPLTTILYILVCMIVIVRYHARIPAVLLQILSEAFSLRSAAGGIGGCLMLRGMREGFARGILSNEAGAGTSAMAHARAETSPIREGISGALEVFFDTGLLCMLTAFVLLLPGSPSGTDGMDAVLAVFSREFGRGGVLLLTVLVACFAFATLLCWYFYGCECLAFLFPQCVSQCVDGEEKARRENLCPPNGRKIRKIRILSFSSGKTDGRVLRLAFLAVFLAAVALGPFLPARPLIAAIDLLLFLLTALNLPLLLLGADRLLSLCRGEGLLPEQKPGS